MNPKLEELISKFRGDTNPIMNSWLFKKEYEEDLREYFIEHFSYLKDLFKSWRNEMNGKKLIEFKFNTCSHLGITINREEGERKVYMNLGGLEWNFAGVEGYVSRTKPEEGIDVSQILHGRENEFICDITQKPCSLYYDDYGHPEIPIKGDRCPAFELTFKEYKLEGEKDRHNFYVDRITKK